MFWSTVSFRRESESEEEGQWTWVKVIWKKTKQKRTLMLKKKKNNSYRIIYIYIYMAPIANSFSESQGVMWVRLCKDCERVQPCSRKHRSNCLWRWNWYPDRKKSFPLKVSKANTCTAELQSIPQYIRTMCWTLNNIM